MFELKDRLYRRKCSRESGHLLIAMILIALVVLASALEYWRWIQTAIKGNTVTMARQMAMNNADSGVQSALQYLRSLKGSNVHFGTPFVMTSPGVDVSMIRLGSATSNLVDVWATGYYLLPGSPVVYNGQRVEKVLLYAQVIQQNVGNYVAASASDLLINYGTDMSAGTVYANDLQFEFGTGMPSTKVNQAYYYNSLGTLQDGSLTTSPPTPDPASFVQFSSPPVHLTAPMNLPTLDAGLSATYLSLATGAGSILTPGGTYSALGAPPNENNVYYVNGDITLGDGISDFRINHSMVIYSAGTINIQSNILNDGNHWLALIANTGINILDTAPSDLTIHATLDTNGALTAGGNPKTGSQLSILGGIITGQGIQVANVYSGQRTYVYQPPDYSLPLPFTTILNSYKVISGKFNQ